MLTFLHGADLHLDAPFHALPPDQAAQRRREQRQLLRRLGETARQRQVDLVFLSGDLFDSQRVLPETIQVLRQELEQIPAAIFLAPGNHDPYTDASPYARVAWPPQVHVFRAPAPERVELPQLGAVVYGSAFLSPHRTDGPLTGFQARDEGLTAFGCFHGDPSGPRSRYGPVSEEEIARSGLTYLALGHLHTASGLRRSGRTFYAWPGCPEGRGFDETGEKGVYLGQVTETGVQLDFVPLAGRRYLASTLDITGRDPAQVLEEALAQAAPQDILRLRLTGQREEDAPPDLAALTAQAAACCYRAEVVDETVLSRSAWDRQGEDTLTGLFLQTMARRLAQAPAEERPLLERAVRFGLAALEGREEPT